MPAVVTESKAPPPRRGRAAPAWLPVAIATGLTLVVLLWLDGFFTLGRLIPQTIDINPAMVDLMRFHFPPHGFFVTDYWLGQTQAAASLQPLSLLVWLPMWIFFTGVYPLFTALAIPAAYLFLRELGFGRAVAVTAAVFFAWQGEIFSTLLAGHFPAPMLWALLPFSAWLILLCGRRDDFFLAAAAGVGIGLLVALLPDRGMLCSVLLGGLFLVEAWLRRKEGWKKLVRVAGRLAMVVAMAGLISFPDLSATLKALVADVQDEELADYAPPEISRDYGWATQWSWTPEEAVTYLVPGALGWYQDSETGPYWGRIGESPGFRETGEGLRNHRLATFSWGTLAVPLFALGLLRLCGPKGRLPALDRRLLAYAWFLLVAAAVGYLLALGKFTPAYSWFYQLPGMDTWRNPLKFLMPVSLGLLVAVAAGADLVRREMDGEGRRGAVWLCRVFVVLTALVLALFALSWVGVVGLWSTLLAQDWTEPQASAILANLRLCLGVATLVAGLATLACWWLGRSGDGRSLARWSVNPFLRRGLLLARRPGRRGSALLAILAVIGAAQMLWAHSHYVNLFPVSDVTEPNILIQKLREGGGDRPRIKIMRGDPVLESLLQRSFRYHGIESLDIPAFSRFPSDYRAWFHALGGNVPRLLQLSSVRYFVMPTQSLQGLLRQPEFGQRAVGVELFPVAGTLPNGKPSHAVLELRGHLPRASLVPGLRVLPTRRAVLSELSNPHWKFRQSILVDRATASELGLQEQEASPDDQLPPVEIVRYGGREVVLKTDSPVPAFLRLTDRYDSDWRATVNGEPTAIFPTDFIFRGVKLPAGPAEVVLTFDPPVWPVYLQLGAWLGFLVAGVFWWRSRRRAEG
ncbi:MAG: hypothetical protein AAGK14_13980 [Verrucomicrobiota bacterium]